MGCSSSVHSAEKAELRSGKDTAGVSKAILLKMTKEFGGEVHGPCSSGLQVEGCKKWMGAALAEKKASTVEFRSFFLPPVPSSALKRMMGGGKKFAEFNSFFDTSSGTWTIYKVFLNGVLPNGQRLGAKAVAEHLSGLPDLETVQADTTDVLPARVKAIKLESVVNWNTFMLMKIAASPGRSVANELGDHMAPMLQEELRASGMTEKQFKSMTVLEVFNHTALGKLVRNILALWRDAEGPDFSISEVAVEEGTQNLEMIGGEMRFGLDIIVTLSCGDKQASDFDAGVKVSCDDKQSSEVDPLLQARERQDTDSTNASSTDL